MNTTHRTSTLLPDAPVDRDLARLRSDLDAVAAREVTAPPTDAALRHRGLTLPSLRRLLAPRRARA